MLKPKQLSEFVAGGARAVLIEALTVIAIVVAAVAVALLATWLS
jgi:hypothetical protein